MEKKQRFIFSIMPKHDYYNKVSYNRIYNSCAVTYTTQEVSRVTSLECILRFSIYNILLAQMTNSHHIFNAPTYPFIINILLV